MRHVLYLSARVPVLPCVTVRIFGCFIRSYIKLRSRTLLLFPLFAISFTFAAVAPMYERVGESPFSSKNRLRMARQIGATMAPLSRIDASRRTSTRQTRLRRSKLKSPLPHLPEKERRTQPRRGRILGANGKSAVVTGARERELIAISRARGVSASVK